MKLTKLELSGFKSFADTVELAFEDGVTAIVGPNGCGKSNVSDAVRWVLGEQSARLLRGGKMEDVIFQGSAHRKPVNVCEVSLFLDNSDNSLPVAYQEVVITRRLSRSGASEYLINRAPARLKDVHDLLRGTGMGSDAGVVIEAKMIDLLLSDRAEERRSLFEEAAGIGLYRDRKHSTERRLEETQIDLQRLEDLIAEVQSQIRSLARQKGKAERHAKYREEQFNLQVTLATRQLAELTALLSDLETRHRELNDLLPQIRQRLTEETLGRDALNRARELAEATRTSCLREANEVELGLEHLQGELALAEERSNHTQSRRHRAEAELRETLERIDQARLEQESTLDEMRAAQAEKDGLERELSERAAVEESSRQELSAHREQVRAAENSLHNTTKTIRALEGEKAALETELTSLRETETREAAHYQNLLAELDVARSRSADYTTEAAAAATSTALAAQVAEQSHHLVDLTKAQEAAQRSEVRKAEEILAQSEARTRVLEELERERVGLAPGSAALLAIRERFGDAVLGPLSDFISTDRATAELSERLLGEWMHAVLVTSSDAVPAIMEWHGSVNPGTLVLLPIDSLQIQHQLSHPGNPLAERLHADAPAARWVNALLNEAGAPDVAGNGAIRRANGAIVLLGHSGASGPLSRRAELAELRSAIDRQSQDLAQANDNLAAALHRLREIESAAGEADRALRQARESERQVVAQRDDADRLVINLEREAGRLETQLTGLAARRAQTEARLTQLASEVAAQEEARLTSEGALTGLRLLQAELEGKLESAREARVHWQVQDAHISARIKAAEDRAARAKQIILGAEAATTKLQADLVSIAAEYQELEGTIVSLQEKKASKLLELETRRRSTQAADESLVAVMDRLSEAERQLSASRSEADSLSEEFHQLELKLTEAAGARRRITERIEADWRAPLEQLRESAVLLDLDKATLEQEAARVQEALDAIGPVNPLAVEEHAEESKRLEFLISQRDDLIAARQSLLQAIKEIDGTAKSLFLETFAAIHSHFTTVFHTLFGGGECDIRLSDPDNPLDAEIEIHAAPRGKRTQRIHLLSSGERTLVATSLLFAIYLTKPSPFCLMDEVDAPLDDANVGRFTTLLQEFKDRTQFLVITHNPRTMHAADAVYGVTMQDPGVSTIVGVRLGETQAA